MTDTDIEVFMCQSIINNRHRSLEKGTHGVGGYGTLVSCPFKLEEQTPARV